MRNKIDDTIQELVNDEYEANDVIGDAGIKDETGENDSEEAGDNDLKNYDQEANCELFDNGNKVDTANDGEEWYCSDNVVNGSFMGLKFTENILYLLKPVIYVVTWAAETLISRLKLSMYMNELGLLINSATSKATPTWLED